MRLASQNFCQDLTTRAGLGQLWLDERDIPAGGRITIPGDTAELAAYVGQSHDIRRESVLERRDTEEALAAVIPPPDEAPKSVEMARVVEIDDEERQQKFWRFVIIFIVALYASETYLANRKQKR